MRNSKRTKCTRAFSMYYSFRNTLSVKMSHFFVQDKILQ